MRLMTRRSNQVMYAMPVRRPMMMTSERTISIRRSNTRDQRLLAHDLAERWVLVDDALAQRFQVFATRHGHPESDADFGDDAPVGPRVDRRRGTALLVLDPTFEVQQAGLA